MNSILEAKLLIKSMSKRMSWESQLRPLLKNNDYETHLGVERTVTPLIKKFEDSEAYSRAFLFAFKNIYDNALLCGNRTIQLYKIEDEILNRILESQKTLKIEPGLDLDFFPYYIEGKDLDSLTEKPKLTRTIEDGDLILFYFSTNRKITEKIKIDPLKNDSNKAIYDFLSKYDKVTAYSSISRHYIDIITINRVDKTLDIRIDATDISSKKDIDNIFESIKNEFSKILFNEDLPNTFSNKANFFKLINELYKDNNTGRVVEISFTTDGGYIHSEKDRAKQKDGDVRKGLFHKGGIEKTDIDPFRISKRWRSNSIKKDIDYEYELTLNSKYRDLSSAKTSYLDHAIINMALTTLDYDDILSLLKKNELFNQC